MKEEELVVLGIGAGVDIVEKQDALEGRRFWRDERGGRVGGNWGTRWASDGDCLAECVQRLLEFWIVLEKRLDLGDGVKDGGVILAAEGPADLGEGLIGELSGEIHRDLAR